MPAQVATAMIEEYRYEHAPNFGFAGVNQIKNSWSVEDDWEGRLRKEFKELSLKKTNKPESDPKCNNLHIHKNCIAGKNRYSDVIPVSQTRVRLNAIEGMCASDYINANFIDGEVPNSYRHYIACQAPLPSTINDFWRMIWEQRCGVIVMVTALKEGNVCKADVYWPGEKQIQRYGDILVCHRNTFQLGKLTVRSLLVKDALNRPDNGLTSQQPSAVREVVQIQYEEWPDFGVANSTLTIIELMVLTTKLKRRAEQTYKLGGPVAVHCSAGIGRTGVFIAAHITMQNLIYNYQPNIQRTVDKIRRQRYGMVKNVEQYVMIYKITRHLLLNSSILDELRSSMWMSPQSSSSSLPSSSSTTVTPSLSDSILVVNDHDDHYNDDLGLHSDEDDVGDDEGSDKSEQSSYDEEDDIIMLPLSYSPPPSPPSSLLLPYSSTFAVMDSDYYHNTDE